jgi:hypothetical protein
MELGVAERLIPTHLSMRPSKAENNKLLTERTNASSDFEPVSTFFIRIFLPDLFVELSKRMGQLQQSFSQFWIFRRKVADDNDTETVGTRAKCFLCRVYTKGVIWTLGVRTYGMSEGRRRREKGRV